MHWLAILKQTRTSKTVICLMQPRCWPTQKASLNITSPSHKHLPVNTHLAHNSLPRRSPVVLHVQTAWVRTNPLEHTLSHTHRQCKSPWDSLPWANEELERTRTALVGFTSCEWLTGRPRGHKMHTHTNTHTPHAEKHKHTHACSHAHVQAQAKTQIQTCMLKRTNACLGKNTPSHPPTKSNLIAYRHNFVNTAVTHTKTNNENSVQVHIALIIYKWMSWGRTPT